MDSGIKQALTECNLSYFNVSEKNNVIIVQWKYLFIINDQKET